MGLAQVQALMAGLFTDEPLRERFFDDPTAVGREYDLSADELRQLERLSERQAHFFAAALLHKRLNGVAGLLPLTREALGDRFHDLFERYASSYAPRGVHKHRDDALAFAAYLERLARVQPLGPVSALDQLRYEAAWLRAAQPEPCCLIRSFRHPVTTRPRLFSHQGPTATSGNGAIGIWLRLSPRGRLRHTIWPRWWPSLWWSRA